MTGSQSARSEALIRGDELTELSSNRTSMAFERTRMGGDRTLMSVARSALSMSSFGFVIHEFSKGDLAGRALGVGMLVFGLLILAVGVAAYGSFVREQRRRREALRAAGLLHAAGPASAPPVLLISALLLAVGVLAFLQTTFHLL